MVTIKPYLRFSVIQDSLYIDNTFVPIENNPAPWVVNNDIPQINLRKDLVNQIHGKER